MIYYYIRIRYICGDKPFLIDYTVCFTDVWDFFINLKKKHKDNFELISIKEKKGFMFKTCKK